MVTRHEFAGWLQAELDKRRWTMADLARESGVTTAMLTLVMQGARGVGPDSAARIAAALGIQDVDVLRAAGRLKPLPDEYPMPIRNTISMMSELNAEDQADVEALVRALRERRAAYYPKRDGDGRAKEAGS